MEVEQDLIFSDSTAWRSALSLWLLLYFVFLGFPLALILLFRPSLKKFAVGFSIFFAVPALLVGEAAFEYLLFVNRCYRDAMVPWVELRPMNIQGILLIPATGRPDECGAPCIIVLRTGSFKFVEMYADPDEPDGPLAYAYFLKPAGDPECDGLPFNVGRGAHQVPSCTVRKPVKSIMSAYGLKYEYEWSSRYPYIHYSRSSFFELNTKTILAQKIRMAQEPSILVRLLLRLNMPSRGTAGVFMCRARYLEDPLNLAAYRGRGT